MSPQKEIVIIGAGVIGCSIAYHLARQGFPSQIIERDSIANRASGKAWALIPYPAFVTQFEHLPPDHLDSMPDGSMGPFIELFWEGYDRMPDMALYLKENGGLDIGFGGLAWTCVALSDDEEKGFKYSISALRNRGYHQLWWMDEKDLKSAYPDINPKARGGMVVPNLQVEPYRYTLGLAQVAEKMGANFRQGEAVGFKTKGSRVTSVTLATGTEVEADVFVLAMGPWNQQSTAWLGKKITVVINQEECLKLQPVSPLPPIALGGGTGEVIIPKVDGSVILGHSGAPDPRPDYNSSLKEENKIRIMQAAVELLPSLGEAKLVEHRGDLMNWAPAPRHWQPALGLVPGWDNAYVAVRIPFGVMLSLGIGRCMADFIIGEGKPSYCYKNLMEVVSPARL